MGDTMKTWRQTIMRIAICLALAAPMYYVEKSGGRERLGFEGYIVFVALYWVIQAVDRFRNPLHGALVVIVLAVFYALAVPGWVHSRASGCPNKSVQATAAARFRFPALVFFAQSSCRLHPSPAAVPDLCR